MNLLRPETASMNFVFGGEDPRTKDCNVEVTLHFDSRTASMSGPPALSADLPSRVPNWQLEDTTHATRLGTSLSTNHPLIAVEEVRTALRHFTLPPVGFWFPVSDTDTLSIDWDPDNPAQLAIAHYNEGGDGFPHPEMPNADGAEVVVQYIKALEKSQLLADPAVQVREMSDDKTGGQTFHELVVALTEEAAATPLTSMGQLVELYASITAPSS